MGSLGGPIRYFVISASPADDVSSPREEELNGDGRGRASTGIVFELLPDPESPPKRPPRPISEYLI